MVGAISQYLGNRYLLTHTRLFTLSFLVKLLATLKKLILSRASFILFAEGSGGNVRERKTNE